MAELALVPMQRNAGAAFCVSVSPGDPVKLPFKIYLNGLTDPTEVDPLLSHTSEDSTIGQIHVFEK